LKAQVGDGAAEEAGPEAKGAAVALPLFRHQAKGKWAEQAVAVDTMNVHGLQHGHDSDSNSSRETSVDVDVELSPCSVRHTWRSNRECSGETSWTWDGGALDADDESEADLVTHQGSSRSGRFCCRARHGGDTFPDRSTSWNDTFPGRTSSWSGEVWPEGAVEIDSATESEEEAGEQEEEDLFPKGRTMCVSELPLLLEEDETESIGDSEFDSSGEELPAVVWPEVGADLELPVGLDTGDPECIREEIRRGFPMQM
jgi:hypothetical protein